MLSPPDPDPPPPQDLPPDGPMRRLDVARILRLERRASPPPWTVATVASLTRSEDLEFAAAARTAVRALTGEVERLHKLAQLKKHAHAEAVQAENDYLAECLYAITHLPPEATIGRAKLIAHSALRDRGRYTP